MKQLFLPIMLLCLAFTANAQLEKIMHQTFEISEAEDITIDLMGDYAIEHWAGNTIMTETKVELFEASPAILKHFVEKAKRYNVATESINDNSIRLYSTDKERKAIRTKFGECYELVNIRVFIPENYEILNDSLLTKKDN